MFAKTPTKGMRDFLPEEFRFRQKVLEIILNTYEKYGFSRIATPSVENIELLCSKQGGDNEKLIYKILKRGEKLEKATDGQQCDLGLRYDLTVPLARFFANNQGQLPSVFKAMQMDYVWRADRPQRGRFRQFMQCDIDILGEESNIAEMDLIVATMQALKNLGFNGVTVKISDRRLLTAIAEKCGFEKELHDKVFIILDKLDKIGIGDVMQEIEEIAPGKSVAFVDMLNRIINSDNPLQSAINELGETLPSAVADNLRQIIAVVNNTITNGRVVFDVTLVRGMGYYTGTIYEISLDGLDISAGGGGRYDEMIGKITGTKVPACGFSIGFERIVLLLSERGVKIGEKRHATALVIPKKCTDKQYCDIMDYAQHHRENGTEVSVVKRIKNFAFQLKQLREQGFDAIYEFKENGELVKID